MNNNINIKEKMQKENLENIRSAVKAIIIDLYTNSLNWVMVTERPYHDIFIKAGIPKKYIPQISHVIIQECVIEKTGEKRITSYKFNSKLYVKPDFDEITDKIVDKISDNYPKLITTSRLWGRVIKRSAKVTKFREKPHSVKDWVYLMYNDELRYGRILNVSTEYSGAVSEINIDDAKIIYEVYIPEEKNTETTYDVFTDVDSLIKFLVEKFNINHKK